ncbi:AAA family ATPase [Actinoplanes sp. NPDC023714]|uniref:AAA family ATPase n=1 Tax=Actinoplanes sp. NPDC023714 TaxID=3154322 RepID=UPI0033EF11AC
MFIKAIRLDDAPREGHPFDLPVVRGLRERGGLRLTAPVTLLAGDNGSGKSTLVEAIAVAAGFNPEGGTTAFNLPTRPGESALGAHLTLSRPPGRRPRTGFFLRAESFYNVATAIDQLGVVGSYGGRSLHERSHGESFLDLVAHRFGPAGLYVLDEPEAALSVNGCLALLVHIAELVAAGSQFVVATHSPILLACPDATIVEIGADGTLGEVGYDQAEAVALTRTFLADPQRMLRQLLAG